LLVPQILFTKQSTALLDSVEPLENVTIAGQWKPLSTPMRNASYKYRDSIAKNVPLTNF